MKQPKKIKLFYVQRPRFSLSEVLDGFASASYTWQLNSMYNAVQHQKLLYPSMHQKIIDIAYCFAYATCVIKERRIKHNFAKGGITNKEVNYNNLAK